MTAASKSSSSKEPLLTIEDVAAHCQVCPRTVHRWIADGQLRSLRLGRLRRIRRQDFEHFLWEGQDGVI